LRGETGLFFDEPTSEHLTNTVLRCEHQITGFNALRSAASVQRFNKEHFLQEFAAFAGVSAALVNNVW